jgi:uncharacterized protein (TIGR02996 family)
MPNLIQILEEDLVADPDDLATHMAYADYLTEQGDPRGELIQIQLELERLPRTSGRRTGLRKRTLELITAHGRAWLGELAPYLLEQSHTQAVPFQLHRGWLDTLYLENLTVNLARTVALAPQVRLLSQLDIDRVTREGRGLLAGDGDMLAYHGLLAGDGDMPAHHDLPSVFVLFASPNLSNLRKLQIRVQHLRPEGIRAIVDSPHLSRLTHLSLHDSLLGPDGVEAVVESGILGRLKVLDLRECLLGDASARVLANADLGNLDLLNLDDNHLSNDAADALRKKGVPLQARQRFSDFYHNDEDLE